MRLELANFPVDVVALGSATRLDGRRLTVSASDIEAAVANPAITGVDIQLVHPGESARITQISDIIEPRIKVHGSAYAPDGSGAAGPSRADGPLARGAADVFPGLLGPLEPVGSGCTNRL